MRVDDIRIEWDEDGCSLVVESTDETGEEEVFSFLVDDPASLYKKIRFELEPYMRERKEATRAAWRLAHPDHGDAYELDDPKSEGYHDRMSEIWDSREKA